MILTQDQRFSLLQSYLGHYKVTELGYGTVRDYSDSWDHIPLLANRQGDLKDFQRPWTVKAILGACTPGSRLLEIGAGEPIVAQILAELGYRVTVFDPYDGTANGPQQYSEFCRIYSDVEICRASFPAQLSDLNRQSFDCIYSISVLEHISEPGLSEVFEGIRGFLKPNGHSIHSIDHVTAGNGADFHHKNLIEILKHQAKLQGPYQKDSGAELAHLERTLRNDIETFYLSPQGHNLWRGGLSYDQFPFRRVVSILSCVQATSI